jgi:hypothetical protein
VSNIFGIRVRVYGDVVFFEFGLKSVKVVGVAKRIEGFVGILDCEFMDGRVFKACFVNGAVEMGSVT